MFHKPDIIVEGSNPGNSPNTVAGHMLDALNITSARQDDFVQSVDSRDV